MRFPASATVLLLLPLSLAAADTTPQIDWPDFLARQDLVWNKVPETWGEAPFIGNGDLGATVHAQGRMQLAWEVNRESVTHRGSRYELGRVMLQTSGTITSGDARVDLWNAEARGSLHTDRGDIQWRTFAAAAPSVIAIEFTGTDGENQADLFWLPVLARPPEKVHAKAAFADGDLNPPPTVTTSVGEVTSTQRFLGGGACAMAMLRAPAPGVRKVYFVSIGRGDSEASALAEAEGAVERAASMGVDALTNAHRERWHAYYPASFVSIPDARIESFYWIQMYKLGSALRPDGPPLDLMGPWFRDTAWPTAGWALAAELAYSPLFTANHLDLGRSGFASRRAGLSPEAPGGHALLTALHSKEAGAPQLGGVPQVDAALDFASHGQGDEALASVNLLLDGAVRPNTFYVPGGQAAGPVLGPPLAAATCLEDMLLQSGGGSIEVFPAMPSAWKNAAFATLRAAGGFLVSAVRRNGATAWVRIESPSAGGSFGLFVHGWKQAVVRDASFSPVESLTEYEHVPGRFSYGFPKGGGWIVLAPSAEAPFPALAPVGMPGGPANPYPQRYKQDVASR